MDHRRELRRDLVFLHGRAAPSWAAWGRAGLALMAVLLLGALAHPGVERWPIKTSLPTGGLSAAPYPVPLATLLRRPTPPGIRRNDPRYQASRLPCTVHPCEGDVIQTAGWLHLAAAESDGDDHLQLSTTPTSQADCLIVETPDPRFVAEPNLRSAVTTARQALRAILGHAPRQGGTLLRPPIAIVVTGQLFLDDAHVGTPPRGKRGCSAQSLWELHPVTALRVASRQKGSQ